MNKKIYFVYDLLLRFSKLYSRKNLYGLLDLAIKKYCRPNYKIINIGAGGEIKKILLKRGLDFKEMDINERRHPDYICSVESMDIFPDESIDIFFCMEVLEHVKNPFNAIKEIKRTLKPGGMIVGSTPFIFPMHDEPHDFYRYTKYGLVNLFQDFKKIELAERNSYIESIYVVLLRLINIGDKKQRLVGTLLLPIYLLLAPLVFLLSGFITNRQSTTGYFFIFQK